MGSQAYPYYDPTASTSLYPMLAQSGYGHEPSTPTYSDVEDPFAPRAYPHPPASAMGWGDQPGTHRTVQGGYGRESPGSPGPNMTLLLKDWTNEELGGTYLPWSIFVKPLMDKILAGSDPLLPEPESVVIGTAGKLINFNHLLI